MLPEGVLPPIVTPFRKDRFDEKAFRANLSALNETALAGYVVLGSNGESELLEDDEAIAIVEVAAEARGPGKTLVVGTGRQSTRATIDLTERAAKAGADAVLVVAPSYYRPAMTPSALEFHYRAVADASPVPVILYHVPKYAPVSFAPEWVVGLANHPNIHGLKDTSGDMVFLAGVLRDRPRDFRVYVGNASVFFCGLALGADGGVLAIAQIAPAQCLALFTHARAGDWEAARALQLRLLSVNQSISAQLGVAGIKHALDLVGLKGGEPRRPLEPLSRRQEEDVQTALERAGIGAISVLE